MCGEELNLRTHEHSVDSRMGNKQKDNMRWWFTKHSPNPDFQTISCQFI